MVSVHKWGSTRVRVTHLDGSGAATARAQDDERGDDERYDERDDDRDDERGDDERSDERGDDERASATRAEDDDEVREVRERRGLEASGRARRGARLAQAAASERALERQRHAGVQRLFLLTPESESSVFFSNARRGPKKTRTWSLT